MENNKKKPNIVFILSDDQGAWAMRHAGNKHIVTPNFDKLAETGTRFENFFCSSPVCSPARATILTGKMPSQHGVQDWVRSGHYGDDAVDYLEGQVTLPDILKKNGYECALSGKWHLGDVLTVKNRFPDHTYVHLKGAGHYYNAPMVRNDEIINDPKYITDSITDDAIDYLDKNSKTGNPFYLSVHYTAPHNPWTNGEHPKEYTDLYKDCDFDDLPSGFIHEDAVYRYNEEDARECRIGYYAAISAMDKNVGRIVDKLDELGIRDNTIIIYTSDNGFNCGHHGVWGKGNATLSLNMFDTSVKVPCIVNLPGYVKEGQVSDELVSQYDFLPTLLDYLGLDNYYTEDEAPGKSFLPLLKGESMEGHETVGIYDEYGMVRMVRTKEWKYVHRYETEKHELYDLVNDPNEDVNLYGLKENENRVAEMRSELVEWFDKYSDEVFDGSKQPVRGNGQIRAIDKLKAGELAFDQDRKTTTDPIQDPSVEAGNVAVK